MADDNQPGGASSPEDARASKGQKPNENSHPAENPNDTERGKREPVIRDRRRVDPSTGAVRQPAARSGEGRSSDGAPLYDSVASGADLAGANRADGSPPDAAAEATAQASGDSRADEQGGQASGVGFDGDQRSDDQPAAPDDATMTDFDRSLLDAAEVDLLAEMRTDMLRAKADLVNFRQRVERDRAANRDAVIAEVIRALLPALDDLSRAEAHGDLVDGAPLTIVAQKLRGSFERFGLVQIGAKGEAFDPAFHEAVVQLPSPDVTVNTIADVFEPGYLLGERLVRAAKVAVSVPAE